MSSASPRPPAYCAPRASRYFPTPPRTSWSPIGSGRGLNNRFGLTALRAHFPGVPLIIDAGIGVPSHAAQAMELGFDAVLINTAVAQARDPVQIARAFRQAG